MNIFELIRESDDFRKELEKFDFEKFKTDVQSLPAEIKDILRERFAYTFPLLKELGDVAKAFAKPKGDEKIDAILKCITE